VSRNRAQFNMVESSSAYRCVLVMLAGIDNSDFLRSCHKFAASIEVFFDWRVMPAGIDKSDFLRWCHKFEASIGVG
jgi:hypothetical protein